MQLLQELPTPWNGCTTARRAHGRCEAGPEWMRRPCGAAPRRWRGLPRETLDLRRAAGTACSVPLLRCTECRAKVGEERGIGVGRVGVALMREGAKGEGFWKGGEVLCKGEGVMWCTSKGHTGSCLG